MTQNRSQRRKLDREVKKLIHSGDGKCTLCKTPFEHNSKTFVGFTLTNHLADVGQCCLKKLKYVHYVGLYCVGKYDRMTETDSKASYSADDVIAAVDAFQTHIKWVDEMTTRVAKLDPSFPTPTKARTHGAWMSADKAWFEAHPTRSHYLRPPQPGEAEDEHEPTIPGHERMVIVRQVEPGLRRRLVFQKNIEVDIPDCEPLLHALCDLLAKGPVGVPVKTDTVAQLAKKYAAAANA